MTVQVDYSQFKLYPKDALHVDEQASTAGVTWKIGSEGEKIWMGQLEVAAAANSSTIHHGDADTVHYVRNGEVTIVYGVNFKEQVLLKTGDFIYFPPFEAYMLKNESATLTTIITTLAPKYSVQVVEPSYVKPTEIQGDVLIVRAEELDDSTIQTANLPRKTAVQAPNLWIGRVSGAPAKDSGAHHHDEAETAGFIIRGNTRILHGENYELYEDLQTGDFLRVPPFLPHIERNLSDKETIDFLTARNPKNFVVNLDEGN